MAPPAALLGTGAVGRCSTAAALSLASASVSVSPSGASRPMCGHCEQSTNFSAASDITTLTVAQRDACDCRLWTIWFTLIAATLPVTHSSTFGILVP